MAPSQTTIDTALAHPIDLVTRFVARHDWLLREQERDAILAEIPGRWSDYQLAVSWQDGEETMQVVCRIDMRAEQAQVGELALARRVGEHRRLALECQQVSGRLAEHRTVPRAKPAVGGDAGGGSGAHHEP